MQKATSVKAKKTILRKKVPTSFTLDKSLREDFKNVVAKKNTSMSEVLTKAVATYVKRNSK